MTKHVLVLAGNLEEYRDWVVMNPDVRWHVYVAGEYTPQGFNVDRIEEVGSFSDRPDASALRAAAERARRPRKRKEEKE